jgi:hypothetical protein
VAAQQVPTPVIRLGDWVEVGNEVFMNIIASSDIRYQTTMNYDFEDRIQDRVQSRNPLATVAHTGEGDFMWVENRFGVDFRYQKNLQLQVLLEHQFVMDGNMIDNVSGASPGPATQTFEDGGTLSATAEERNTFNVERYWIDYKFPDPVNWLRMRVGADLWFTDQAGVLADDDPRFAVFATFGPKNEFQIEAAAVIQFEASRLGLQNDNDLIYYTAGIAYEFKPFKAAVHGAYFRDRFTGAHGQAQAGQKLDSFLIMPSVTGSFGPISFLLQGLFLLGSADSSNATGNIEYDIWAWGGLGMLQADLGIVKPYVGIIYGSGDDDPNDTDLEGFAPTPFREITIITGTRWFDVFDTAASFGARDVPNPARSRGAAGALAANQGVTEFRHSVGNPFSDRIGNAAHNGMVTTYSNPGALLIPAGIQISPVRGHQLDLYYVYNSFVETRLVELAFAVNDVSKSVYHEAAFSYVWAPSPHFDVRITGGILIPADGVKDVAATTDCNFRVAGIQPCEGEDVALKGEARIRARF